MHVNILVSATFGLYFVTLVACEALPSPTKIRVTTRSKTSFAVKWEQPPSQIYERFSVKIFPEGTMEPADTASMSRVFTGLRSGSMYSVTVQGFTSDGMSSKLLRYVVWTVPDEPKEMRLTPVQEIAISVSIMGLQTKFTAVVDGLEVAWKDEKPSVSGYDLKVIPDEGVTVSSADENFAGIEKRIITGLTPGKEYSVVLRSHVGPEYDLVYSEAVNGKRRMPPSVPYSAEVVESDPTSVVLKTHGPLEGIYDSLFFDLTPNHGTVGVPSPDPNYPMFELYPWKGLKPGTSYSLDIFAVSKDVRGYKPKVVTFTTAPAPPVRLRVDDFTHYSVTLQWAHAHKFTGADDIQYMIEFFEVPKGELQFAAVKNIKSNQPVVVEVSKLIPGTVYQFNVYTILNGVKGIVPASIIQTTIPMRPVVTSILIGKTEGITLIFGEPEEGACPEVKTFYSPSLNGVPIKPDFHKLGETVEYPEFPTNGQYRVHARCVSQNVEGPELIVTVDDAFDFSTNSSNTRNDVPAPGELQKRPLPCSALTVGLITRPDTIAPDACCNLRPYNSEQKECCGEALLQKGGDRLCCGENFYNKRFGVCCDTPDGKTVRLQRDGCP